MNAHRHKPSLALADHASVVDDESVPWLPMSPQVEGVSIKYFRLDPPRGESVALLRAAAGARLPRQRQTGTVIVYTLAGRWKLLEDDWIAGPGSVVVLPANAIGMIYALGGSSGGLALYLKDGVLSYEYNLFEVMRTHIRAKDKRPAGKARIEVEASYVERRPGSPLKVVLKVDYLR